jgi:hypothetical protein
VHGDRVKRLHGAETIEVNWHIFLFDLSCDYWHWSAAGCTAAASSGVSTPRGRFRLTG